MHEPPYTAAWTLPITAASSVRRPTIASTLLTESLPSMLTSYCANRAPYSSCHQLVQKALEINGRRLQAEVLETILYGGLPTTATTTWCSHTTTDFVCATSAIAGK